MEIYIMRGHVHKIMDVPVVPCHGVPPSGRSMAGCHRDAQSQSVARAGLDAERRLLA